MKSRTYRCPRCRRQVSAKAPEFPFCSHRCRMIDLGQWFNEEYSVAGEPATVPERDDAGGRE